MAKEQLIKLETIGNLVLESNEQTKGRFKKTKLGHHEYLVLNLDGGMVPWDEVPMEKYQKMETRRRRRPEGRRPAEGSQAGRRAGRARQLPALLDRFVAGGLGTPRARRTAYRPSRSSNRWRSSADKPFTSIGYVSAAMNRQINNQKQNIDDVEHMVDKLLPAGQAHRAADRTNPQGRRGLAEDIKSLIPELGAVMGFSYLSDRGVEGFQYAWGDHGRLDGSKPLGLLQHVGGNPILGVVARAKLTVGRLRHGGQVGPRRPTATSRNSACQTSRKRNARRSKPFLAAALPLLKRMDKANREMLIPALADGQSALVIDGKLQSKHFIESLPATDKPMPMLEPALVVGVSNAKLLKQALGEYREIVNGLIDAVRQIEGSNVPEDLEIPEPQVTEGSLGTIYSFPLPEEWGVDAKIVPNFGVSDAGGRVHVLAGPYRAAAESDAAGGRRRVGQRRPSAGRRRLARIGPRWSRPPRPGSISPSSKSRPPGVSTKPSRR